MSIYSRKCQKSSFFGRPPPEFSKIEIFFTKTLVWEYNLSFKNVIKWFQKKHFLLNSSRLKKKMTQIKNLPIKQLFSYIFINSSVTQSSTCAIISYFSCCNFITSAIYIFLTTYSQSFPFLTFPF